MTENKPPQKQQQQDIPKIMEVDITHTPNKKPWHSSDSMEERMKKMEEQMKVHAQNLKSSNIAISKIREELDAETNERKMDMLVLSGIRPSKRFPYQGSFKVKSEWARVEAITALKKFEKKTGDREVKWANCISNPNIKPLVLEVKLSNREVATSIKKIFRDLKRDDLEIPDDM